MRLAGERVVSVVLVGRSEELGVLDALVEAVRRGESRVLVVRGEPGIGKSALIRDLTDAAVGFRVETAAGVESEMELPFAGLHQLCGSMLDHLDRLPAPQRDALGVAFGLRGGDAPDRYIVGLAVLGLFSEVAAAGPLLAVVDDMQWLDRASVQALEFVARRPLAEPVALVCSARGSEGDGPLAGLPELALGGLDAEAAQAVLSSVIKWPLDEPVRDRIIAETRGNPLALLELPRGLSPAELAGGFGLPSVQPIPDRIEASFRRRVKRLPSETQRLLLLAAAEPLGDPRLLWGAAERLGVAVEAADAAVEAGLVEFGARVTFHHPLVRSAVYRAAAESARREAHGALAEVTDARQDPDRRAWHRAHATAGLDEDVAVELERSAGRAQARGGPAAAAAFFERASSLTVDPHTRAERALAAARLMTQAGAFDGALGLLTVAEAGPLSELQLARAELLRGQVAFGSWRGDAPALLLKAAKRLEPRDVGLARETYLEALSTGVYAGRFVAGGEPGEVAAAARAAPAGSQPPDALDLLLEGSAMLMTDGYATAGPTLKRAVSAFRDQGSPKEEATRWLWLACANAVRLWDDESWHVLSTRHIELARAAGALGVLPIALNQRVTPEEEPGGRGAPVGPSLMHWATAVLNNSAGRYHEAADAAELARADTYELVFPMWAAIELIEAGSRSGMGERGAETLERLSETTRAGSTDWALGVEARSRALLSEGEAAERFYLEAIERLARTRMRVDLARGHLVYGEWLRRGRRRIDGREQLVTANEMFVEMGAQGFAERAGRELQATGRTARRRSVETSGQLTPQEAQVARLARDGLSNAEIGARLFISARTVQYHLRKVFTKLGITSRTQLDGTLPNQPVADAGE